ncbi:hypothetical protein M2408_004725 [Sphingobacterium sp. BIGb0165]|nr:hypothetical protein [Sphingobacterium sp. BIGb0165]
MKIKQLFLNPFADFSERTLFLVGITGFLLSSYLIYLFIRSAVQWLYALL